MIKLRTITDAEYAEYLDWAITEHAKEKTRVGDWKADTALELSRHAYEAMLPQGPATVNHSILAITELNSSHFLGVIWYQLKITSDAPSAYIFDVYVTEESRSKGIGSQAMIELERSLSAQKIREVRLNVFCHNASALHMYTKLGYEPTHLQMIKKFI